MTSGNIIRVKKPEKYAIVSQDMLRDSRLSFAARGLLAYLLSKPANWSMQTEDLISQSPAGRDAIYSMLKELEVNGYLKRERVRDEKGHVHWETTVYELPELAAEPNTAFPDTVQPDTVKPDTVRPYPEKPHHKNYVDKELSKKKEEGERDRAQDLLDFYSQNIRPIGELHPNTRRSWLALIENRLREDWTTEQIQLAIKGCKLDEWKMTKGFNGVPDILTKRDETERLIELGRKGISPNGKKASNYETTSERNVRLLRETFGDEAIDSPLAPRRIASGSDP